MVSSNVTHFFNSHLACRPLILIVKTGAEFSENCDSDDVSSFKDIVQRILRVVKIKLIYMYIICAGKLEAGPFSY